MSRVGQRIKEARLKSGMTQKALAKKLGVAEKYINDVELGRKVVQESFINKAAKILNADLNDINMVVTDEPGIYIPGKFGVRIEDTVQITKFGCIKLTNSEKNYIVINKKD